MVILRLEKNQHGTNAHDLIMLRRILRANLGLARRVICLIGNVCQSSGMAMGSPENGLMF